MAENDETSLLDIGLFVAENWLLIILAPIVIAIVVYFIAASVPRPYVATVTVVPPHTIPLHITTPLYTEALKMRASEEATVSLSNGAISISAAGSTPEMAEGRVASHLQRLVAALNAAIAREVEFSDTQAAQLDRLNSAIGDIPPDEIGADAIVTQISLTKEQARLRYEISNAENWLAQLQEYPVPTEKAGRSPILFAILAGFVSVFTLTLFSATRVGIRRATESPEDREKLERIKAALPLMRARKKTG